MRVTLRRTLATIPTVTRVVAVNSGEDLLTGWVNDPVDVVLLALGIPGMGCTRTIEQLLTIDSNVTMLALAGPRDAELVRRALAAGAHGYLPKDASRAELLGALAHVVAIRGATVGAPQSRRAPVSADGDAKQPETIPLSRREMQVLIGLAQGASNRSIGEELGLSGDTVKTHVGRMFRKLSARDRAHAVAIAYRQGIVR